MSPFTRRDLILESVMRKVQMVFTEEYGFEEK